MTAYGAQIEWQPTTPRLRPLRLIVSWMVAAVSVYVAAGLVGGVSIDDPAGAFLIAAVIAVVNAVLPPLIAALRLPFTLVSGFLLVLFADAGALMLTDELFPDVLGIGSFGDALLASLVMAAASIVLQVLTGTNDDDEYTLRVVKRVARRQGSETRTDAPGIVFLEIDGLGAADPAQRDARRQRPQSRPLDLRAGLPAERVGDRPLLADGSEPGRDPARLQRGHPGLSLGREGDADDDDLLGARGLRRDRTSPRNGQSACSSTAAPAAGTCSPARPTR